MGPIGKVTRYLKSTLKLRINTSLLGKWAQWVPDNWLLNGAKESPYYPGIE